LFFYRLRSFILFRVVRPEHLTAAISLQTLSSWGMPCMLINRRSAPAEPLERRSSDELDCSDREPIPPRTSRPCQIVSRASSYLICPSSRRTSWANVPSRKTRCHHYSYPLKDCHTELMERSSIISKLRSSRNFMCIICRGPR
jgi:hypothetical protein